METSKKAKTLLLTGCTAFAITMAGILPITASAQTWKLVSPGGGGSGGGVDCPLPWGDTLNHGDQITLYKDSAHPQCASIARPFACSNGMLVGHGDPYQDYRHPSCTAVNIGEAVPAKSGAVYIGNLGENHLYLSPADDSTSIAWKTENSVTANTQSDIDGHVNTYNMNNSMHPAAKLCAQKSPAGTWYLPAKDELAVIWENRTAINLPAKGLNHSTYYWSSTEYGNTTAWVQRFSDGSQNTNFKNNTSRVRCVRR